MRSGRRARWGMGGVYAFLVAYAVWSLLPVLWVLVSSFKRNVDVLAVPPKIVFHPTWANYPGVLETVPGFGHVVVNSVTVAAVGTAVIIALSLPAAYALNRFTRIR